MALLEKTYNRRAAVAYAHRWAYFRNPNFFDFSGEELGGDCTNYASQCLLAGGAVMNYTPEVGWYYIDVNNRAPAWTGVGFFHDFLIKNEGIGPYATQTDISAMRPGDFIQMKTKQERFHHTPIVTEIRGFEPNINTIYIAAHSQDCDCRPLSSYDIKDIRFLHIEGIRYSTEETSAQKPQDSTQKPQNDNQKPQNSTQPT